MSGKGREAVYQELLGDYDAVYLPDLEDPPQDGVPPISIYVFRRDFGQGPFFTLATGGMSDHRMHLPEGVPDTIPTRAELLLYVRELKDEYVGLLRWLARFPFVDRTWLGFGHTIQLNEPPFGDSLLRHLLLLTSLISPDKKLPSRLQIEGDPVEFLWVVPITPAEREHKIANGVASLLDLFESNSHPWILDESRPSYVDADEPSGS